MKGILIAIPVSLALWAIIFWAAITYGGDIYPINPYPSIYVAPYTVILVLPQSDIPDAYYYNLYNRPAVVETPVEEEKPDIEGD